MSEIFNTTYNTETAKRADFLCHEMLDSGYPIELPIGYVRGVHNTEVMLDIHVEKNKKWLDNANKELASISVFDDATANCFMDTLETDIKRWKEEKAILYNTYIKVLGVLKETFVRQMTIIKISK